MDDIAYLLVVVDDRGALAHYDYSFEFAETTRKLAEEFENTDICIGHTFKIFEVEVPNPDAIDLDFYFEQNATIINAEETALYERNI